MNNHLLLPGTQLDERYRVDAVLGEGGFGITYAAENMRIGLKVAVKELFWRGHSARNAAVSSEMILEEKDRAVFQEQKERFLREARIIRDFSDLPGVVRVLDYFEANATAYIVMEYVEGETLSAHLARRGRLPAEALFRSFLPLIDSLGRIHAEGIIHRDISPDNIMVQPDGSLKLIDFGAARAYRGAENAQYTAITKDSYAPGEQYDKNGRQGPWTDVYALCATLYTGVTGVAPLSAIQRLFLDELKSPSQLGADIAAPYEAIIMRGLNMAINKRFADMDELAQAVRKALPIPETASRPSRSIAVGVLTAFLCIAVVLGIWRYHIYDANHKFRGVETETFILYAPAEMSAADFAGVQKELIQRLESFAGEDNYLISMEGASIRVEVPLARFGGEEIYAVLRREFMPLVYGKRYNVEYQLQAHWENPSASMTAGQNQVLPSALEGELAEISYDMYGLEITPGQRANLIVDMKSRLDALDTPYAFGSLYGDENTVVIRISPERLTPFVLDSLGCSNELLRITGEYSGSTPILGFFHTTSGVTVVEYEDGSFGIRCAVPQGSSARLDLDELAEFMRASGQNTLYLQSDGNYALAQFPLNALTDDDVIEFKTFCFENLSSLGAEQRWLAEYVDTLVNETELPFSCELSEVRLLNASGETEFGASLWDSYGLRPVAKESDRLFYERLRQITEEKGYACRIGDKETRLYLNLDLDEHLIDKLSAAIKELMVDYGLKDMVINANFTIQIYDAKSSEICLLDFSGDLSVVDWKYMNRMSFYLTKDGRFAPFVEDFSAWWASFPWEEWEIKRGFELWR